MKNSLQILNTNNNEFTNQNGSKRKRNFTGKENIDPLPSIKKEQKTSYLTKSSTTTITTPNVDKSKLKNKFEALLEVTSVEYEALNLPVETNNSIAKTLISNDPFLNEYYEYIQYFPYEVQLLLSEFQDLDAQQIVKNHQLKLIKAALNYKKDTTVNSNESNLYSSNTTEQLLNKMHIILKQSEMIGDQKIQKSMQINQLIKVRLKQLDIDYKSKDESSPRVELNDEKILNNFMHKIQTNDFKSKNLVKDKTNANKKLKIDAKTSKEANDDIYTIDDSSDEYNPSENESSTTTSNLSTDPDDLFCHCRQSSFGQMICCDNKRCKIGWFHFSCVQLKVEPKGEWFCSSCINKKSKKKRKILKKKT